MDDFNASSSNNIDKEEVIKSTKAKMGEVKEENERLKRLLAQLVTDYKSLEHQILSISKTKEGNNSDNYKGGDNQDHDLVSLTLGRCLNNGKFHVDDARNKIRKIDGGLVIDLDRKVENYQATNVDDSIKNSTQDLKTKDKKIYREGDEESLYETQLKKTRVCIRSRCDTPTMNDGCHWRKYGQKIAKGNPCPRAYYRCTISTTCPVRKQVQRCVDDMSILLTTYEGTHNHPLPLSATAMASATSAAASMIKTSASTSQQPLLGSTTSSSFGLHSSTLINLLHPNHNPNPRITISNPSMISSSSHAHPTVTLDLTTPNHTTLSSSPSFNTWLSSSSNSSTIHPSNNFLDFSSSTSSSTCSSSSGFSSWASGYFNSQISSANKNNNPTIMLQNISPSSDQSSLNEMITKAIASNPTFQSVLAAAISSYYVGTTTDNKASNDMKKSPLSTRSGSKEDHASDDDRIS